MAMIETALTGNKRERSDWLAKRFKEVRDFTGWIVAPLGPEDCVIQSMPDVSPTRWHLAHTTWFFEAFVLDKAIPAYEWVDPTYNYLFNSYYNALGEQFPRAKRGFLSRPTVAEVLGYRAEVERRMSDLLSGQVATELLDVVEIGIHHEQQHQELMLTDIKHVLFQNPLYPEYRPWKGTEAKATPFEWMAFEAGLTEIGHAGGGFTYDNEGPRHKVYLEPFELAIRLATNGEFLAFMEDGGYARPEHWLSLGWATAKDQGWSAPFYWVRGNGYWQEFTLSGLREIDLEAPICHLSYFEADAFARWSGGRLPTEFEWEHAATRETQGSNFVESYLLHPAPGARSLYGDAWQWTSSSYAPYPGYKAAEGAIGEYNGKFMCNQYVLRGGSCATSKTHIRRTYRNFFPTDARWQFSGVRLARS